MLTEGFWHILSGFVAACRDSEVVFTAHDPWKNSSIRWARVTFS
jgi:hypothetical protein